MDSVESPAQNQLQALPVVGPARQHPDLPSVLPALRLNRYRR